MDVVDIDGRFELKPRQHSARSVDAGFELGFGDVPVVAADRVGVSGVATCDLAIYCWQAVLGGLGAFVLGSCESGGCEEEEE